jgi:hypothetical protein
MRIRSKRSDTASEQVVTVTAGDCHRLLLDPRRRRISPKQGRSDAARSSTTCATHPPQFFPPLSGRPQRPLSIWWGNPWFPHLPPPSSHVREESLLASRPNESASGPGSRAHGFTGLSSETRRAGIRRPFVVDLCSSRLRPKGDSFAREATRGQPLHEPRKGARGGKHRFPPRLTRSPSRRRASRPASSPALASRRRLPRW